ncbi:hypothetical protein ACJJJB_10210 [Microbulbifer sp. ANSA001]|uniref:hypothetical protein n=1 Tax=Microbulbifer sp. ANSA001 TaxID=3243358 RepID=UPI0040413542
MAGLFIWGSDVEKGITANPQAIEHEPAMLALEQKYIAEFKDEIRTRLQRIDSKLECLIERGRIVARRISYREEFAEKTEKLCKLGLTDKELGEFFEVTEQTINNWKNKHSEFFESIKRGKIWQILT